MVAVANREGYARASVTPVIAEAGVSRPTFYEYFADKDACFLAAVDEAQRRLLALAQERLADEPPRRALQACAGALTALAVEHPELARFLMCEPMAGGPAAMDARDRGIDALAAIASERASNVDAALPDFPAAMLLGAVQRLLAARLRRGERNLSELESQLTAWIDTYCRPARGHRHRQLRGFAEAPRSPLLPPAPLAPPPPLPPGRTRLSEAEVANNQRLRIMFAAAHLAGENGYNATTIAAIIRAASVDGRVLYSMFADKQDVFIAVHEYGFQRIMDLTARAFFSGSDWLERHWEAGRAFGQFLAQNPLIANVGFVESYAVGGGAAQRLQDSQRAFAMLLLEGYNHGAQPPPLAAEAIIATIFEIVYRRARDLDTARLPTLLPHFTFLVLAPFIGVASTEAFIDRKLAQRGGAA